MTSTLVLCTIITGGISLISVASLLVNGLFSHFLRVRRRVQEEFGSDRPDVAARSPLFKEPDQTWSLPTDAGTAVMPRAGLTQRLEIMLEQSGVSFTLGRLALLSTATGMIVGLVGTW